MGKVWLKNEAHAMCGGSPLGLGLCTSVSQVTAGLTSPVVTRRELAERILRGEWPSYGGLCSGSLML